MRVLIVTHGSRGDVQPLVGLAAALMQAGHGVTLAAPAASAWLADSYCDRIIRLHDGPNELAADSEVVKGLESGFRGLIGKRRLVTTIPKTRRLVRAVLDDLAIMARDMATNGDRDFDLVVHHVAGAGHDVAEFLGVPSVLMCPQPYWVPTSSFPDPSFPWRWPHRLNRATYFTSRAVWWAFSGSSTRWRKDRLGLKRRRGARYRQVDGSPTTVMHPFSELLLPPGTDYPQWVHTTGFWFLPTPADWRPPERLAEFLANGEPPVCLGFASTVSSDPRRLGRLLRDAVRAAGVRAVVVGGWSGVTESDLGDDVAFVESVPFDWLFRHVAAVVHHGGLGTTGTAMAAGRPQVVCPIMPDQRFNGRRLHALGVAPQPIAHRELSVPRLAVAIRQAAYDRALAVRAMEVGHRLAAEDGVGEAVKVLEAIAGSSGRGTADRATSYRI